MCLYTDFQLWLHVRSQTWKEKTQSRYMLIGIRQADFRATRAQSTLQSACATRGWLFFLSPWRQWRIHLLHIFKTCYLILQRASKIGSPFPCLLFQVSLFCFVLFCLFFKCSILLRGFSQKLKSSFQAQSFCRLHFKTGEMNIAGTKQRKERLLTRLLKAQELVLSFRFCGFSPLLAAKKAPNQMQTKKSVF